MEKILRRFIHRGLLESCDPKGASPCLVVPKKVAGEWRLVVDCHSLYAETYHDRHH